MAWFVGVRFGMVWPGELWRGEVRYGRVRFGNLGKVVWGRVR